MVQRIRSGLAAAKAKGKKLGRPTGRETAEIILRKYSRVVEDLKSGLSLRKTTRLHGLSKGTVLKVKKALSESGHIASVF